jgi:flagellar biosynthesis protein FlhB
MSADQDQRTHAPTQKRIEDFRKRGEIALSRDLTAIATFVGGAVAVALFGRSSVGAIAELVRNQLAGLERIQGQAALDAFAGAVFPICAGALAAYVISTALQLGFPPGFKIPGFDLSRIVSTKNLTQLFSPKAAARRLFLSLAKVTVVGIAAAVAVQAELQHSLDEPTQNAVALGMRLASGLGRVTIMGGGALAALAALDFWWTKRSLLKRMKMTPAEVKREHKEQEGDPLIRRKRRQRMRELAKRRLVSTVKTADVVVVNPTHYAVALRYRAGESTAPKVIAKGKGAVATRIRELAREAGVPILSQPPLARLLHKLVPEGREIPGNLYQAVAEVLAYVYRLRARRR